MSKTILIIEDNTEIRENIQEILELSGYLVKKAANGKEGVKAAKEFLPDLILCDIMMPDLDGYSVLNILQKDTQTAAIPFLFLTAKADKSDIRKGMIMGADDYITKPFDDAELLAAIDARFKRSEFFKVSSNHPDQVADFFTSVKAMPTMEEVMKDKKQKKYEKKQIVYNEGDTAQYVYYIIKGKIKCSKMDMFGKELTMELYGAQEFFGYQNLFCNSECVETAVCMESTELILIPKTDFDQLLQKNKDVAIQFIKLLANHVKEKEERLLRLAFTPVRERTAHALVELHVKFSSEMIRISREDLANIVGTATESLIRTLSDFKEEQVLEMLGREIKLVDIPKLKKIAGY